MESVEEIKFAFDGIRTKRNSKGQEWVGNERVKEVVFKKKSLIRFNRAWTRAILGRICYIYIYINMNIIKKSIYKNIYINI